MIGHWAVLGQGEIAALSLNGALRACKVARRPATAAKSRCQTEAAISFVNDIPRIAPAYRAVSRTSSCPPSSSFAKNASGARLRRRYDAPRTPLERVLACADIDHAKAAALVALRDRLDPFALAAAIDRQLDIFALANHRQSPGRAAADAPAPASPARPRPHPRDAGLASSP